MGKYDITDELIKQQHAHIEEFDNLIALAEKGTYVTMSDDGHYISTPAPDNSRERKAYIKRLKAQRKHSEDVLIALQNNFDGADAMG